MASAISWKTIKRSRIRPKPMCNLYGSLASIVIQMWTWIISRAKTRQRWVNPFSKRRSLGAWHRTCKVNHQDRGRVQILWMVMVERGSCNRYRATLNSRSQLSSKWTPCRSRTPSIRSRWQNQQERSASASTTIKPIWCRSTSRRNLKEQMASLSKSTSQKRWWTLPDEVAFVSWMTISRRRKETTTSQAIRDMSSKTRIWIWIVWSFHRFTAMALGRYRTRNTRYRDWSLNRHLIGYRWISNSLKMVKRQVYRSTTLSRSAKPKNSRSAPQPT